MLAISLIGKSQFTYFGATVGQIIADLTNPQKIGALNSYAEGKSITYIKHVYLIPTSQGEELYSLFDDVNMSTDTTLYNNQSVTSYSRTLDSLESWFADDDILRVWLDSILHKKVEYCTHPDTLSGLNDAEKWSKYLELLRSQ